MMPWFKYCVLEDPMKNKISKNAKAVESKYMKDTKSARRTGVSEIHGKLPTEGN